MSPTNENVVNGLIDTHRNIMGCAYGDTPAFKTVSHTFVSKDGVTSGVMRIERTGGPRVRTFATDALGLTGNVDHQPNAHMAGTLWALRTRAGSGLLPVTFEGDALVEAEAKAESKLIAPRYEVDS